MDLGSGLHLVEALRARGLEEVECLYYLLLPPVGLEGLVVMAVVMVEMGVAVEAMVALVAVDVEEAMVEALEAAA